MQINGIFLQLRPKSCIQEDEATEEDILNFLENIVFNARLVDIRVLLCIIVDDCVYFRLLPCTPAALVVVQGKKVSKLCVDLFESTGNSHLMNGVLTDVVLKRSQDTLSLEMLKRCVFVYSRDFLPFAYITTASVRIK